MAIIYNSYSFHDYNSLIIGTNNTEAVYEDPDSFQQYTLRKDQNIELKECPAYEKPIAIGQSAIELEECPAYVERKKDVASYRI